MSEAGTKAGGNVGFQGESISSKEVVESVGQHAGSGPPLIAFREPEWGAKPIASEDAVLAGDERIA